MCKFYDSSLSLEDNEFKDPVFFAQVPWLSCGRVLQRFTIHLTSIQTFLKTEEMLTSYSIIKDQKKKKIIITLHMNELNLKLQEKENLICEAEQV